MVHEFGHNLGLGHNSGHLGEGYCKDNGFVMIASGQVRTFGWSPCSKKRFQARYLMMKKKNIWCMGGKLKYLPIFF